jgi:hypothetical protein
MTDEKKASDELRLMAKTLKELQLSLEPIRDKALDEKARLTGYAQCAEQMISIIVARMADCEKKANAVDNPPIEEAKEPVEETKESVEETKEPAEETVSENKSGGRKKKGTKQEIA